jgi:hypothetical protein
MFHRFINIAAWATLAFIAFATLSPLGLRPAMGDPDFERFSAYGLAGLLLALAYPRHLMLVMVFVVVVAGVLEILQLATPDRHGQFANALVKAAGGIVGVAAAVVVLRLVRNQLICRRPRISLRRGNVASCAARWAGID